MDIHLKKFDDLVSATNEKVGLRLYDFALNSNDLKYSDLVYCQEMARQGRLCSFSLYFDKGANDPSSFSGQQFFYKKGVASPRRKVYIYRLPFFHGSVEASFGRTLSIGWGSISVKNVKKEMAENSIEHAVKSLFIHYIKFIRTWIAKGFLAYEDSYHILEHYANNDGIITIPECFEHYFLDSLTDIPIIPSAISNHEQIRRDFTPKLTLLNHESIESECPFCLAKNVFAKGITTCVECDRSYMI